MGVEKSDMLKNFANLPQGRSMKRQLFVFE